MFVQHKSLKSLNVAAQKIAHLHVASSSLQLAFPGYAPQLCRAYLLQISGSSKVLILVAFYLMESQCTIFFVPKRGEVYPRDAERMYEEGYLFAESMGFVLTETDYHLFSQDKKQKYWTELPICQPPRDIVGTGGNQEMLESDLDKLRERSLGSLGRFLASM